MKDKPVALVTGANKGIGLQIGRDLAASGLTVLVGARNPARGEQAAKSIGSDAYPLQLDVTNQPSISAAVVSFLAGPDGAWGNSQGLRVNGGFA